MNQKDRWIDGYMEAYTDIRKEIERIKSQTHASQLEMNSSLERAMDKIRRNVNVQQASESDIPGMRTK